MPACTAQLRIRGAIRGLQTPQNSSLRLETAETKKLEISYPDLNEWLSEAFQNDSEASISPRVTPLYVQTLTSEQVGAGVGGARVPIWSSGTNMVLCTNMGPPCINMVPGVPIWSQRLCDFRLVLQTV